MMTAMTMMKTTDIVNDDCNDLKLCLQFLLRWAYEACIQRTYSHIVSNVFYSTSTNVFFNVTFFTFLSFPNFLSAP